MLSLTQQHTHTYHCQLSPSIPTTSRHAPANQHTQPQTALGREQAHEAGEAIRAHMQALHGGSDYNLYFYTSPYKRGVQTYEGIR